MKQNIKILLFISLLISANCFGQVKIPIQRVINSTVTAKKSALFDEQGTNVQVSGSSNQSIKPANSNAWFNSPQLFDANTSFVRVWNGYTGRYRTQTLPPSGITLDVKFNGTYTVSKVCIFMENREANNSIVIKSGTPFNFTTQATVTTQPVSGQWYDLSVNFTTEWVQLALSEAGGVINEIVFYGTLQGSTKNIPAVTKVYPKKPLDSIIATNMYYGMGWGNGNIYYDNDWPGGERYYAAAAYLQYADGSLKHPSGTANESEMQYVQRLKSSGSAVHFVLGSLVDSGMVSPTNNSGGDWASQKPIPSSLMNEGTAQRLSGIMTFNEIAETPASYARAAWSLRKYAKGGKQYMNIGAIEPDNEKDGPFKSAGYFYPYQIAAAMSAYYDGHGGTITYSGDSVGVWNTGVKLIFPALSYINPDYIEAIIHWWQYNRPGGFPTYPLDYFNVHAYPSTLEVQWSGSGQAVAPEDPVYNLEAKLDTCAYFSGIMGKPFLNTEIGFDMFPTAQYNCSFTSIHKYGSKTEEDIQMDLTTRSYLMHARFGAPMYQYWLSDQYPEFSVCQTFQASGFLSWTTHNNFLENYIPRKSWYAMKTLRYRIGSYVYDSEVTEGNLRKQLYINPANTNEKAYVVWMITASDSFQSTSLNITGGYKVVSFNSTTTGNEITGTGPVTFVATETPKIIMFSGEATPPTSPTLRNYFLLN